MSKSHTLILASSSSARRALLTGAGLTFDVIPARIDEDALTKALQAKSPPADARTIAMSLAVEKALAVSRGHPGTTVIGADQVLSFENKLHAKALNVAEARGVLQALRGKSHELVSAAALARDGKLLWQGSQSARLTMRDFSESFLTSYLENAGAAVLACVGCYELEGLGVQLFSSIEGDYFTILGLPLVPLLGALRTNGVLAT